MSFPDLQHTAYFVSSGDDETQEGEEEESEEESEVTFRLPAVQDTTNVPNVRNKKR
jgi:hypothetical protein